LRVPTHKKKAARTWTRGHQKRKNPGQWGEKKGKIFYLAAGWERGGLDHSAKMTKRGGGGSAFKKQRGGGSTHIQADPLSKEKTRVLQEGKKGL